MREQLRGHGALVSASALGAAGGFAVWGLWRPLLGYDGATYHLSAVVRWVQTGSTGSVQDLIVGLPAGNYPLTNEAGLAWAVGISQSFAPVAAWAAAFALLFGASAWLGLRGAGVSRPIRVLTIAAVCLAPVVLRGIVQAETDFPAVAWIAAAAALASAARRRPPLIGSAILAAALGVGTKTTVAPVAAAVLLLGLLPLRRELRSLLKPIALGVAAGAVVGGWWYLRNLADHGSPLWPLVSAPWGDPVPPLIRDVGHSLLERPAATFRAGVGDLYRDSVAGGLVLIAAALAAPLWSRSRATLAGAAITLVALLAWASAPFTGAPDSHALRGVVFSTLRYALPVLPVAAATLALASRAGRRAAVAAAVVAVTAIGWSAERYAADPYLPGEAVLVLCVAGGAALAGALVYALRGVPGRALLAPAAVAAVAALTLGARGYLGRHASAREIDAPLIAWLSDRADWAEGRVPVAAVPTLLATLAGDQLEHRIRLIGADAPCERIRAEMRNGYILTAPAPRLSFPPTTFGRCLAATAPSFTAGGFRIYRSGAAR